MTRAKLIGIINSPFGLFELRAPLNEEGHITTVELHSKTPIDNPVCVNCYYLDVYSQYYDTKELWNDIIKDIKYFYVHGGRLKSS